MNQELYNFLKDQITLIQEKYNQSLLQAQKSDLEVDAAFYQGANFAYYDTLDLLKSQLDAFGYETENCALIVPELGSPIEQCYKN